MSRQRLRSYGDLRQERRQLERILEHFEELAHCCPHPRTEDAYIRLRTVLQGKLERIREELSCVEQAVDRLDESYSTILRAHYIDGQSWESVCEMTGYEGMQICRIHTAALEALGEPQC